jgi:hypothetical protein
MGREEGCVTHFESLRYRLQAFVSTILKQLNKPPFLPQLCSISSKLVITHTMTPRPTVIGTQGYRRGLASLSVVKERLFRVHRNVPVDHLSDQAKSNWLGTRLAGLIRSHCANSPSSSAYLGFR